MGDLNRQGLLRAVNDARGFDGLIRGFSFSAQFFQNEITRRRKLLVVGVE